MDKGDDREPPCRLATGPTNGYAEAPQIAGINGGPPFVSLERGTGR
jgi:hypothetical protein